MGTGFSILVTPAALPLPMDAVAGPVPTAAPAPAPAATVEAAPIIEVAAGSTAPASVFPPRKRWPTIRIWITIENSKDRSESLLRFLLLPYLEPQPPFT